LLSGLSENLYRPPVVLVGGVSDKLNRLAAAQGADNVLPWCAIVIDLAFPSQADEKCSGHHF
jgi:hypothetical protein